MKMRWQRQKNNEEEADSSNGINSSSLGEPSSDASKLGMKPSPETIVTFETENTHHTHDKRRKFSEENSSPATAVSPTSTPVSDTITEDKHNSNSKHDDKKEPNRKNGVGASSKDLEMLKQKQAWQSRTESDAADKTEPETPFSLSLTAFSEKWSEIATLRGYGEAEENASEPTSHCLQESSKLSKVRRDFGSSIWRNKLQISEDKSITGRYSDKSNTPAGFEPSTAEGCKNGVYETIKLSLSSIIDNNPSTMYLPPDLPPYETEFQPNLLTPKSIVPYDTLGNPFQPSPLDFAALAERKFSNSAAAGTRSYLLSAIAEEMNRSAGFNDVPPLPPTGGMMGAPPSTAVWPPGPPGLPSGGAYPNSTDSMTMGTQHQSQSTMYRGSYDRSQKSQNNHDDRDYMSDDEYSDMRQERREERRRRKSKRKRNRRRRESRRSRSRRKYKSSTSSYTDSDSSSSSSNYKRKRSKRKYRSRSISSDEDMKMPATESNDRGRSIESKNGSSYQERPSTRSSRRDRDRDLSSDIKYEN